MKTYRIHGDNILECEVALELVRTSIKKVTGEDGVVSLTKSIITNPSYTLTFDFGFAAKFEFFPGHNRWDQSIKTHLNEANIPVKESVDAFITELKDGVEIPVLSIEFSSALPAGNNAWQRSGRAISMLYAKIPYIYIAEVGGQELDSKRSIKAPRFPNPIVPFSYIASSSNTTAPSLSVYLASRSIDRATLKEFESGMQDEHYKEYVASLFLESTANSKALIKSKEKSANFVRSLVRRSQKNSTYSPEVWDLMLDQAVHDKPVSDLILQSKLGWSKKISIDINPTLRILISILNEQGAVAVGSTGMPMCIVPAAARSELSTLVNKIYNNELNDEFVRLLEDTDRPAVFIFIAGFKPRGDDSRPDRGLLPLTKMIFGNDDVDLISVVYGPAKERTWNEFVDNPSRLKNNNGLWEAIIGLSELVLIDSRTFNRPHIQRTLVTGSSDTSTRLEHLKPFSPRPRIGEHDVDSGIHLLFKTNDAINIHESMCNPPGGDWSGVAIRNNDSNYLWTSLPRVTSLGSKRPDHIIQLTALNMVLSIESKDKLVNLETDIGPMLDKYTNDLLCATGPQSERLESTRVWIPTVDPEKVAKDMQDFEYVSGAAVVGSENDVMPLYKKSSANIVFVFDFSKNDLTEVYIYTMDQRLRGFIEEYVISQKEYLRKLSTHIKLI